MSKNKSTIRALTLNVGGVPCSSKRFFRAQSIALFIEESDFDFVCLQELYVAADVRLLIDAGAQAGLKHWHVFRNGAGCWGSNSPGLVVLSRFKIVSSRLCRFACSGKLHKLHQMDGMHSKAAGLVRIDAGALGLVCVYVTHFVAVYGKDDEYYAHRLMQARETALFIRETSLDASLVLLCGDLNAKPTDRAYQYLVALAGLRDSDLHANGAQASYARPGNPYAKENPERLDYVLYRSKSWRALAAGIEKDTDTLALSDHAGVFAEFVLDSGHEVSSHTTQRTIDSHTKHMMRTLQKAIDECYERTQKHGVQAAASLVFAACIFSYAPWLTPIVVALSVTHFLIYGVYCGQEMSNLVQAHNECAIELGCEQEDMVLAEEKSETFELACSALAWTC